MIIGGLWLGCYTSDSGADGRGIEVVGLGLDGLPTEARLAVAADSPSYLAAHPVLPVLYAVHEEAGQVQAYAVGAERTLRALGEPVLAGAAACHVAVDPHGRFLVVCCYGDGRVVLIELDPDGALGRRVEGEPVAGSGALPSRAHASLILPDGTVLTTDLGRDLVRVWRYAGGTRPALQQEVRLPHGSGPRHLARHPSGPVYVLTERTNEVAVLRPHGAEGFRWSGSVPLQAADASDGASAHISVNESGTRVYATVRGVDRVVVLAAHEEGCRLEVLGEVDCGGRWPRHHLQLGSRLHVANQQSGTVATFALDGNGMPVGPPRTVAVPSAACLVPIIP